MSVYDLMIWDNDNDKVYEFKILQLKYNDILKKWKRSKNILLWIIHNCSTKFNKQKYYTK